MDNATKETASVRNDRSNESEATATRDSCCYVGPVKLDPLLQAVAPVIAPDD